MSTGEVLGWKFNHAQGICTIDGVVTAFPKICTSRNGVVRNNPALPSDVELAQWTSEYTTWKAAQPTLLTLEQRLANLEATQAALVSKVGVVSVTNAPVVALG